MTFILPRLVYILLLVLSRLDEIDNGIILNNKKTRIGA